MKSRLLLLIQDHSQAAALNSCIPHIRLNYDWVWVVYSPVILADAETVNREYDRMIADITEAMKACYGREDGAGGDAYKAKRDAAVLEKAAKVKDAWKTLPVESQKAAVARIFDEFFAAKPAPNMSITQHPDHFETSAHVELQNSLKGAMKPQFVPGQYVVAWPTALPREEGAGTTLEKGNAVLQQAQEIATMALTAPVPAPKPPPITTTPRFKELMMMNLDQLGETALKLGFTPAGNKQKIVFAILKAEKARQPAAAQP